MLPMIHEEILTDSNEDRNSIGDRDNLYKNNKQSIIREDDDSSNFEFKSMN